MPSSAQAFSRIWRSFGVGMYTDKGFQRFQEEWFYRRYNLTRKKFADMLNGKRVLEVGTGAGAFQRVMKQAKESYAIDIAQGGVEIAKAMNRRNKNVHVVLTSVTSPQFLSEHKESFDLVLADLVLHHLPDTFLGLKAATSLVKRGGYMFFYVYRRKSWLREFMDDTIRAVTTHLPASICLGWSEMLCKLGRVLTGINLSFQRAVYWNTVKCFWNPNWEFMSMVRNIWDWYSVPIAHRHTPQEVGHWLSVLGLMAEWIDFNESAGISVRAVKL